MKTNTLMFAKKKEFRGLMRKIKLKNFLMLKSSTIKCDLNYSLW